MTSPVSSMIGVVVIGRNEGERLRRCLGSIGGDLPVVYVDSGSSDGSAAAARAAGAEVVELDAIRPFTAARARNAGLSRLLQMHPDLARVQFVDGDCTMAPGWLERGAAALRADPALAVVCGRRREAFPGASIYNRLCDLEWDTPVGPARSCGGDMMARIDALREVGGYREDVIAGEEPELCVRVRQAGWEIRRIDAEMTLHDAAITRFGQWFARTRRAGHAFAEGAWLHGRGRSRHNVRRVASVLFWAILLPVIALGAAWSSGGWSLLLLAGYPILWARIMAGRKRRGGRAGDAALYATFCTVGKLAEAAGVLTFAWRRLLRRRVVRIIEYKGAGAAP